MCFSFSTVAEDTMVVPVNGDIESGVYTIKNVANGQNLNAFDLKYSVNGYAYTDKKSGEEKELALSGLFLAVGHKPETAAFADAVNCDAEGFFAVGEDMNTKTEGVFVAGDCRAKTVRQLTTAVGDGATAALSACKYIDAM